MKKSSFIVPRKVFRHKKRFPEFERRIELPVDRRSAAAGEEVERRLDRLQDDQARFDRR